MSDRDQGNVGSNRQGRAESGRSLSGEVLEKGGRDVIFFLLSELLSLADPTRREIARPAPDGERQVPVGAFTVFPVLCLSPDRRRCPAPSGLHP